jgi:hypothetical protein
MTRPVFIFVCCIAGAASLAAQTSRPESAPASRAANGARLVVVVVVDQLATDVFRPAWPHLGDDGFKRIAREGADFPEAAHDHACTETAPGHATVGTGASPSVHGILANDWPDPITGFGVNAVNDGSALIGPPLGVKSAGASTSRLKAPTLGDAMKAAYGPASKVAGLSLKARSALLTTGRAADVAAWLDYETGWWTSSPTQGPALSPWLAAFNRDDRVAALFGLPWERGGPDAAFADLGEDKSTFEYGLDGRTDFPHRLDAKEGSTREQRAMVALISPAGNEVVLEAAYATMRALELGKDDVPDFLYVGFSANDLVGHAYGPASFEVRSMTLKTDAQLAELMRRLDADVGPGRWNLALSADHGVGPTPERAVKEGIKAGRVDTKRTRGAAEAALTKAFGDPAPEHWTLAQSGYFFVLNRALLARREVDAEAAEDVAAVAIRAVEGVASVHPTRRLLARGAANELEACVIRTLAPDRMPDLYVIPSPYHLFSRNPASHGTPYAYDRRVPVMIMGPGVRAGFASTEAVSPASMVVTLARLLGIPGPAMADHQALPIP